MKFIARVFMISAVFAGCVSVSLGQGSLPVDLIELQGRYREAVVPIEEAQVTRLEKWRADYQVALEKRQKEMMSQGNLDASLALKTELESITRGTSPEMLSTPASKQVTELRTQYLRGVKRIHDEQDKQLKEVSIKYIQNLGLLEKKLTSLEDLDGALLVRAERDQMIKSTQGQQFGPSSVPGKPALQDDSWRKDWEIMVNATEANVHKNGYIEFGWHGGELGPDIVNRPPYEGKGRHEGLLVLHPLSANEPAILRFRKQVSLGTPRLVVLASGNIHGDCLLRCTVDGRSVGEFNLRGDEWTSCEFDLSEFAGRPADIELQNVAGGANKWKFEHCFIDQISFKSK